MKSPGGGVFLSGRPTAGTEWSTGEGSFSDGDGTPVAWVWPTTPVELAFAATEATCCAGDASCSSPHFGPESLNAPACVYCSQFCVRVNLTKSRAAMTAMPKKTLYLRNRNILVMSRTL